MMLNFFRQLHHPGDDNNDTTTRNPPPPKLFSLENPDGMMFGNEEEYQQLQQQQQRRRQQQQETETDKTISSRLNKLSLEERTQGIYELHGVASNNINDDDSTVNNSKSNNNNNTGGSFSSSTTTKSIHNGTNSASSSDKMTMTTKKLNEVTSRLDALMNTTSSTQFGLRNTKEGMGAYRIAWNSDKEYVNKIKLLCLKADYYDTAKATNRLIAFFDFKQSIFGQDKLCKEITFDDLDSNAQKALVDEGRVLLLGQRDRAGRAITMMYGVGDGAHLHTLLTWCQIYYYINMTAIRDPAIQENGMVFILWAVGKKKFLNNRPSKLTAMWSVLPMKLVAVHICYDSPIIDMGFQLLAKTMESRFLCRCRGHFGTYLECIYEMMTFGIPKDYLPFDMSTGNLDLTFHKHWIETRKLQEQLLRQELQLIQQREQLIKMKMVYNNNNKAAAAAASMTSIPSVIVNNNMYNNNSTINDPGCPVAAIMSSQSSSSTPNSNLSPIFPTFQQQQQQQQQQHIQNFPNIINNSSTTSSSIAALLLLSNNGNNTNEIVVPGPFDIILGRGRHPKNSMGYMKFRNLIDEHVETYDNAEKIDKMEIASDILQKLNSMGCRFLRRSSSSSTTDGGGGGYSLEECTPEESKEKICHTFRNIRVVKKQQKERKQKKIIQQQQAGQVEVGTVVGTGVLNSKKRSVSP